jgi:hypothetical protein
MFWERNLVSTDTAVATLAVDFFQGLKVPTVDAASLFAVFRNTYDRAVLSPAHSQEVRHETQARLSAVAFTVARTLQAYDADDIGAAVLDFFEYDRTKLNILNSSGLRDTLLPLLRFVKDPQTLTRLPHIYETYCDSSYSVFGSVPDAPSPEIDAWLWDIVRNPAAHGIQTDLDLGGVWKAMERRNVAGLLPYLRRIADGSEVPALAVSQENMPLAMRRYATDIIRRIER